MRAVLRLNGSMVAEQDVVVATTDATTVTTTVASSSAPAGAVFSVELLQGSRSLLTGQLTLP